MLLALHALLSWRLECLVFSLWDSRVDVTAAVKAWRFWRVRVVAAVTWVLTLSAIGVLLGHPQVAIRYSCSLILLCPICNHVEHLPLGIHRSLYPNSSDCSLVGSLLSFYTSSGASCFSTKNSMTCLSGPLFCLGRPSTFRPLRLSALDSAT